MYGHISQYDNLGKIGEGTYGVVMKSRHKGSGKLVAIKKFKEYEDEEEVRKTAMREVKVLQSIRHDNIICLLDVFHVRRRLYLVFEYVEGTVLQELEKHPHGMGDMRTRQIMWQLVRAVEYLHSNQIVHRDIKPENMLLSSAGMLKLCDFGFARYLSGNSFDMSEYVATRWYRAPELLVGDKCYGQSVDIWAIGCMLVEMHTGQPLYPGADDTDQLWLILKTCTDEQLHSIKDSAILQYMKVPPAEERETLEDKLPMLNPEAIRFLEACLHPHPDCRKSAKELLQMPYLFGARSWYIKSFHPSEARKAVRHAMSVERERGKPRQFRRSTESRNFVGSDALNISPFRGKPLSQLYDSSSASSADELPPHCTRSPLSRLADSSLMSTSSPLRGSKFPEAACHIKSTKEGKKKGDVINIAATSNPMFGSFDHTDAEMTDAPSISGTGMGNLNNDGRGHEPGNCEADSHGLRRSMRIQNYAGSPLSSSWQGGGLRQSQQFLSPDPRSRGHRGGGQVSPPSRHPHRQGPQFHQSNQSPTKAMSSWRVDGTGQHTVNGRTAQPGLNSQGAGSADHLHQGIPAYYGFGVHGDENGPVGQGNGHGWKSHGEGSNEQPLVLARNQCVRSAAPLSALVQGPKGVNRALTRGPSPTAARQENGGRAVATDGNVAAQFRSPLRAHAPVFIPSSFTCPQGKKAELH